MKKPFILYHWSPASRRKQILKQGLRAHKISRCGEWKPPYLCFSNSPSHAWAASAAFSKVEEEWDLWMCWSNQMYGGLLEKQSWSLQGPVAEYRLYEVHVPKKRLWFVGSRLRKVRKK